MLASLPMVLYHARMLEFATCDAARLRRDPAYDGVFFVAVRTTGIYCRPTCPAKQPRSRNVAFYASAEAAEREGYRACRRCRPEAQPSSPAWNGTRTTVERALKLIKAGELDAARVEDLAYRLGVGARHLTRLFRRHVGASPQKIAIAHRLDRARFLLEATSLPITEVAYRAGFASLRRFNAAFAAQFGRSPSNFRKERTQAGAQAIKGRHAGADHFRESS